MQFSIFPALFDKPSKIRFDQQEADESVELFLRKHGITNVPWILITLVGFLIPPFALWADVALEINLLSNVPNSILAGGIIVFYLLLLAYVIENFLFWYFNIYIVTNKHIVDINYDSLLSRKVVEVELVDVESQSADIKGVIRQLFNFGDVIVETAAERLRIEFIDVPKPDFVADRIQDLSKSEHGSSNP